MNINLSELNKITDIPDFDNEESLLIKQLAEFHELLKKAFGKYKIGNSVIVDFCVRSCADGMSSIEDNFDETYVDANDDDYKGFAILRIVLHNHVVIEDSKMEFITLYSKDFENHQKVENAFERSLSCLRQYQFSFQLSDKLNKALEILV